MAELLDSLRPRAFAIAYRMLGSVSEAEDVVQEALLRLHRVLEAGEEIEVPEALLADDVALHGDGGGKARAITHPLFGRRRVARTLLGWMQVVGRIDGYTLRPVEVNGHPGALGIDGQQRVVHVLSLDIADGQIQGIRSIINPDKLRHLGPLADLPRLLSPHPSPD